VWHRDLALLYTVERNPPLRVVAVGWLGCLTFRLGATPTRFRELLDELCRRPPASTATPSFHPCRLGCCLWRWMLGRPFFAGSAEIIVPGRDGKVYRAPTLIGAPHRGWADLAVDVHAVNVRCGAGPGL